MKNIFFNLILLKIISISPIVPLWNFQDSVTDLLSDINSIEIKIYEKRVDYDVNQKTFTITKVITKNDNGTITEKNTLKIDNEYEKETSWEGIQSIYEIDSVLYVCPTGKNYLNKYNAGNGFEEIKTKEMSGDWDLKCFYFYIEDFFLLYS